MNSRTHKTDHDECCSDARCESGLRNNYFEEKTITAETFQIEQDYMIRRRHSLSRAVHGWGVVNGYRVKVRKSGELRIGAGLALDEFGRELINSKTTLRPMDLFDENGEPFDPAKLPEKPKPDECWLLTAHYAEENVDLVKVKDPCYECPRDEWDHTCETVRFTIRRHDCEECCTDFGCELKCGCGKGDCCGGHSEGRDDSSDAEKENDQSQLSDVQAYQEQPVDDDDDVGDTGDKPIVGPARRGGCQCMCDHLQRLKFDTRCKLPGKIDDRCGKNVRFDYRYGVDIACVSFEEVNGCWTFTKINPCGPRRLVKGNDLLFDLIRGCDLTRITEVGWEKLFVPNGDYCKHEREHEHEHEKNVTCFDAFLSGICPHEDHREDCRRRDHTVECETKAFFVGFSNPVRVDTLRPECFAITVMSSEREGGWWQTFRVPILRIQAGKEDLEGYTREARVVVDGCWVEDALRGRGIFVADDVRVEVEVRGDLIIDCNGQAVDASSAGWFLPPAGNGTPGGMFLSRFLVRRRHRGNEVDYDKQ